MEIVSVTFKYFLFEIHIPMYTYQLKDKIFRHFIFYFIKLDYNIKLIYKVWYNWIKVAAYPVLLKYGTKAIRTSFTCTYFVIPFMF